MPTFTVDTDLNDTSVNSRVQAETIYKYIKARKPSSPITIEEATAFINSANRYGINAVWVMAHAILESGWITSWFSTFRNNLFGIAAYDSNPNNAYSFASKASCIDYYCRWVKQAYLTKGGQWFNGATPSGMNVRYASSKVWATNIVWIMNDFGKFFAMNKPVEEPARPLTYTVKKGGWRAEVIKEIIAAGLLKGKWEDYDVKFWNMNKTPVGGFRPGNVVKIPYNDINAVVPTALAEVSKMDTSLPENATSFEEDLDLSDAQPIQQDVELPDFEAEGGIVPLPLENGAPVAEPVAEETATSLPEENPDVEGEPAPAVPANEIVPVTEDKPKKVLKPMEDLTRKEKVAHVWTQTFHEFLWLVTAEGALKALSLALYQTAGILIPEEINVGFIGLGAAFVSRKMIMSIIDVLLKRGVAYGKAYHDAHVPQPAAE